jgi:hypothetical protein
MRDRATLSAVVLTCLALLLCCAEPRPSAERFAVMVRARSTSDEPVAGVHAWADGRPLGATSDQGLLRAELRGREHASVELSAACPPSYRTVEPTRTLVLRRLRGAGNERTGALEIGVQCEPLEWLAALVILTTGPGADVAGLPIRVGGDVVGQTGTDGSAHVQFVAPPHASLRVTLDTQGRPGLRPRDPVHSFRLTEPDSFVLIEQTFTQRARPRPGSPPAQPVSLPLRPQRLE